MTLEIGDIITLNDNNEYAIASFANYNNLKYYYIVDIKNNNNIKFCYTDNNELVEIKDKQLIACLIPLFLENKEDNIY